MRYSGMSITKSNKRIEFRGYSMSKNNKDDWKGIKKIDY